MFGCAVAFQIIRKYRRVYDMSSIRNTETDMLFLTTFPSISLAARQVVILTTSDAVIDENFVRVTLIVYQFMLQVFQGNIVEMTPFSTTFAFFTATNYFINIVRQEPRASTTSIHFGMFFCLVASKGLTTVTQTLGVSIFVVREPNRRVTFRHF